MVNAALSWVLAQRRSDGLALWAVEEDDRPWDYALLTGTSSIQHALRCGAVLAGFCGEDADEWLQAADHMRDAITTGPTLSKISHVGRWTGTTQCSPGLSQNLQRSHDSHLDGTRSSWTG